MFTLRVPFQLPATQKLNDLHGSDVWSHDGLDFTLKQDGLYYVLLISSFTQEADAKRYLYNIQTGLFWLLLKQGFAFEAEWKFDEVVYADNPEATTHNTFGHTATQPVHGLVNVNRPSIYPSEKRIVTATVNPARTILGYTLASFRQYLGEGIEIGNKVSINPDSRLSTALDLYNAFYYEKSANARLLTLIMALETLSETTYKHQVAQDLISRWQTQLDASMRSLDPDTEDYEEAKSSLESLQRELLFRKEASLRSQIRSFVLKTLEDVGVVDANKLAKLAVKAYDMRSSLVHQGVLPKKKLQDATGEAKMIVEKVLQAIFKFESR
ncbi:MAG: hypothetical protein AAGH78_16235 [Cyanobacteria bacterium P01_H01_bin.58]